jgi:hypothetical protein
LLRVAYNVRMSEPLTSRRQFTLTTLFWFATVVGTFLAMVFAGDGPDRVTWGWALFLCLFIPSAVRERAERPAEVSGNSLSS